MRITASPGTDSPKQGYLKLCMKLRRILNLTMRLNKGSCFANAEALQAKTDVCITSHVFKTSTKQLFLWYCYKFNGISKELREKNSSWKADQFRNIIAGFSHIRLL